MYMTPLPPNIKDHNNNEWRAFDTRQDIGCGREKRFLRQVIELNAPGSWLSSECGKKAHGPFMPDPEDFVPWRSANAKSDIFILILIFNALE